MRLVTLKDTLKEVSIDFMKTLDYLDLKQYVQETSSISYITLDSILSKLDTQNLRDLKEVLWEFYASGYDDGN